MTQVAPVEATDGPALKRDFTFASSFAFGFAFISPIVALYGIFGIALSTAGPSFWWGFLIVFGGQLLVAMVFAMLVSRWPIEGSIYQWSARLGGRAIGWFAGWTYMWTLLIAMATVALAAAGFLANVIGMEAPTGIEKAGIAIIILLFGTAVNLAGRRVLKIFMAASIVAEIIGSLGLGTWLLLFHQNNSISVLFDGGKGLAPGVDYLSMGGPFLVAMVFIGFSFVGFESAGAIAEEVTEPRKNLPRAILFALIFIAIVVMYTSLAIILAVPDLDAVRSGDVLDPVNATLTSQLGAGIAKPVEVLFVIGFLASFLALQTAASRMIWSFARDKALPGSRWLSKLSRVQRQPTGPILVTMVFGAALFLLSNVVADVYTLMLNFTSGGFFLSFLFPLIGFLVIKLRGQWKDGPFTLGRGTTVVAVIAAVWAVFEFLNIAWPRPFFEAEFLNWSIWIAMGVLGGLGAIIYLALRKNIPVVTGLDFVMSEDVETNKGTVSS
jgi:amino acid transporter